MFLSHEVTHVAVKCCIFNYMYRLNIYDNDSFIILYTR